MKKRMITGILLVLIVAPLIYFGGYFIAAFALLLLGLGVYEFLDVKRKAKMDKIPIYIYVISFIFSYLLVFDIPQVSEYAFNYSSGILPSYGINSIWIVLYLVTLFTCSVFDKKLTLNDVVYSFTTTLYLSFGLKGLLFLRSYNNLSSSNDGLFLLIYVFIVTCMTDIFAYFGGMTCYRLLGNDKVHKLNERISPKKTIEGTIVGTLCGTLLGFGFTMIFFKHSGLPQYHFTIYLLLSLVVSICGQIGDLVLSAIKRHYEIKDFSNLLPGHGGVLDRIDSLLINCMITSIFLCILTYII